MSDIKFYYSSISSNREIKKKQQQIMMILDSKKIPYEKVDIAESEDDKNFMREKSQDPTALPPRFFKGECYLGDYDAFNDAVEAESLNQFFGL